MGALPANPQHGWPCGAAPWSAPRGPGGIRRCPRARVGLAQDGRGGRTGPALAADGRVAKRSVIVALGIDTTGPKHPIRLWVGSTENKALCTSLLRNLLERGLRVQGKLFCAIDGGKGLRSALDDVFGDVVVVQRCQNHKRRNVRDHLPQSRRPYAMRVINAAYNAKRYKTANEKLLSRV